MRFRYSHAASRSTLFLAATVAAVWLTALCSLAAANGATSAAGPAAASAASPAAASAAGSAAASAAPGEAWPYLPIGDVGAVAFRQTHPTWDGRGVVIAILDTGVDAFAPGLGLTSLGQTKLIDARDFSTQGDWELVEAERDTLTPAGGLTFKHPDDGYRLSGAEGLAVPPVPGDDPAGRIYIARIPESRFVNSNGVADLNDDGDEHDAFGILVYLADRAAVEAKLGPGRGYDLLGTLGEEARRAVARERETARVWLVAVDTNGDGRLDDEQPLRDYRVNHDTFKLSAPDAPQARTLMAWCVNVVEQADRVGRPQAPRLELHFDDGAHGSHCAGIAAGCRVGGQEGLDGVAPGAWLMSLKIGDNRLVGGATRTESMKKAVLYLADFALEYGVPVVVNMSYGVAAVEEGDDAIGRFLDEELPKHPQVYFCTSAGNEGPGISTVGLPATASSVIASGAYLSPSAGSALYNARLSGPTLFAFSSRGGETPKPDVVAPGAALSTLPGWQDGTGRFNGTSMASPTTAGAVACLLSGALQEGMTTHWGMVKRALIAGASEVPGLARVEQGGGLVNLSRSWELLRQLARSNSAHKVLDYRVETACPFQADGNATAAYWRTPGGVPVAPEVITFTVTPVFHPELSPDERDSFFRSFSLRSEADWVNVVPGRRYLRGKAPLEIDVQYEAARLQRPGLYSARVIAALDGGDLSGAASQEFALWNTVVVADTYAAEDGFSRTYDGRGLAPSSAHRFYVAAPAGASALRVRLEVSERTGAGKGARVLTEICDPEGAVRGEYVGYASIDGVQVRDQTVLPPDLRPGIWEVLAVSAIGAMQPGAYRLTVSFDGYHADPPRLSTLTCSKTGEAAGTTLTVTRAFPGVFKGDVRAELTGFGREETITVDGSDVWTRPFTLDGATPSADFHLTMDERTANLFTDCAVNILDAAGKYVVTDSFVGLEAHVACRVPAGESKASFTLEVVGGFAQAEDSDTWAFELEELYGFASPVAGTVGRAKVGGASDGDGAADAGEAASPSVVPDLYCGVPTPLKISFAATGPSPPTGMGARGSVRLFDRNASGRLPGDTDGRLVLEVPIALEP